VEKKKKRQVIHNRRNRGGQKEKDWKGFSFCFWKHRAGKEKNDVSEPQKKGNTPQKKEKSQKKEKAVPLTNSEKKDRRKKKTPMVKKKKHQKRRSPVSMGKKKPSSSLKGSHVEKAAGPRGKKKIPGGRIFGIGAKAVWRREVHEEGKEELCAMTKKKTCPQRQSGNSRGERGGINPKEEMPVWGGGAQATKTYKSRNKEKNKKKNSTKDKFVLRDSKKSERKVGTRGKENRFRSSCDQAVKGEPAEGCGEQKKRLPWVKGGRLPWRVSGRGGVRKENMERVPRGEEDNARISEKCSDDFRMHQKLKKKGSILITKKGVV